MGTTGWQRARAHNWLGCLLAALVLQESWRRAEAEWALLLVPVGLFWTRLGKWLLALSLSLAALLLALKERAALRPGRGLDLPVAEPFKPFPLKGRNVFITGSTNGIGCHAAWHFLTLGANVGIHGTKQERAAEVARYMMSTVNGGSPGQATPLAVDFGDFADVRRGAAEVRKVFPQLNILLLNAAVQGSAWFSNHTHSSGNDLTMSVNHLAHFLFFSLLEPLLAPNARIVITTSGGAWYGLHELLAPKQRIQWEDPGYQRNYVWGARQAYQDSKLANVCFGRSLRRRLAGRASVVIYDPAFVRTGLRSGAMDEEPFYRIRDWIAPAYRGGENLFQVSFTSRQPMPDGVCSYWLSEEAIHYTGWASWHPAERLANYYIQLVFERFERPLYGLHATLAPPCSEEQQDGLWRWSAEKVGLDA